MKKVYIIPSEKIADLGITGCLLADSNTGAGGYDGSNKPSEEGDGMDEGNGTPSRSQLQWDNKW